MSQDQKEVGRMKLNVMDSLVFQTSEYRGKTYVDIRKYVESQGYTGFTKQGIRFHANLLGEFVENVRKVAQSVGLELTEEDEDRKAAPDATQ